MSAPLEDLLAATSVRAVTDALASLARQERVAWRFVGNNENNLAIINLGSDPAAGVIERVTNALDAVLEREWNAQGQPTNLLSPRQAVGQWFPIPDGHLEGIDVRDSSIVEIAKRVEVTLRDSERRDRPTVDVRDFGVGILAADFDRSILSLNGSRKLRKLFLAGAFGQGGSTALSYSLYTVIASRAVSADGGRNPVALTVVRFNPGDARVDKHGVYEFLVDHATGQPFVLECDDETFPVGTLVRHVSMDLGRYTNIITAPTGSLWYLAHHYLYDPVLPFRITDERSNSSTRGETRTVAGNHRLLTGSTSTEYQRNAALTFRDGTVAIHWWVLSAQGDNARNRITQYTLPSKPIIITFNGQKQGDLPNTIIKNDLRLPYLERFLVVHVNCDRLDSESRRQLFPSTRESVRDTAILDDLRRLVVDTLAGDPELQRLDRERKERYIRRVDSAAVENIRRRLANRIKVIAQVSGGGRSPRVHPPEPIEPPTPRVPIPTQEPPTRLEVVNPPPRRVYAGKQFVLRFCTDADPAYFMNPDTFIAIIDPPTFGQYTGTTNVRDGYGTAYFRAAEDLPVGTSATITIEVRPRRAASLHDSITAEVVPLPESGGSGTGQIPTPNVNPQWVTSSDPFWADNGWSDRSVAKVERTQDSIDVYVSAEQRRLNSLLARAQRRETAAVDAMKDFYLEHMAFYAVLAEIEQQQTQSAGDPASAADPVEAEREHERELQRACEMLCGAIDDVFDLVVSRAQDEGLADGFSEAGVTYDEEAGP